MNNLKSIRGDTNQLSFVESLGIPYIDAPMLSIIEKGYVLPTPQDAETIAHALGVTVRDVWPDYPTYAVHAPPPQKATQGFANGSNAEKYTIVTQHIPSGSENAVSRAWLCQKTGLTDRDIRQRIEDARRDGQFILSLSSGYFYSTNQQELARYDSIERSRAISTLVRLSPIRRYLDRVMPGQISNCWRCGDEASGDFCENCESILRQREAAGTSAKVTTAKENITASL